MKKLLSLALALLMLAMPALSVAEEAAAADFVSQAVANGRRAETTVSLGKLDETLATMMFGMDEATLAIIQDLLTAVTLTGYAQGDEAGFALNLQGMPVFSAAAGVTESGLLLGSNLLGQAPIALNAGNLQAAAERVLTYYADAMGLTAEDIQEIVSYLDLEALAGMLAEALEELNTSMADAEINFSAFEQLVEDWAKLVTAEAVTVQPEDCDPADTLLTLVIPAAEYNKLTPALLQFIDDNPMLVNAINSALASEGITWNDLKPELSNLTFFADDAVFQAYVAGDQIVRFSAVITMDQGDGETLPISMAYVVKDGLTSLALILDNTIILSADHAAVKEAAATQEALQLALTIVEGENALSFALIVANQTATDGVDASDRTDLTLAIMDMPLITLSINTQTVAPAAVMNAAEAIDLAALTAEDFQTWCASLESNASMALVMGVMLLPQSIQQMLMPTESIAQ